MRRTGGIPSPGSPSGSRPSASACSSQRRRGMPRTGRRQRRSCRRAGCPPSPGQRTRRPRRSGTFASLAGRHVVLPHGEWALGRGGVVERVLRDPCLEGRGQPIAETLPIELGELGLVQRLSVDPLDEERDVDLGLSVRDVLRAGRLDAARGRLHLEFRLLRVPARGLIPGPSCRDRRQRKQHRREDIDPVLRVGSQPVSRVCSLSRSGRVAGRSRRRARRPSHRSVGARRRGSRGPAPSPRVRGCRARRGRGRPGTG